MSVSSKRARDIVEMPPAIPALEDAITEEQHLAILEEERKKKEVIFFHFELSVFSP